MMFKLVQHFGGDFVVTHSNSQEAFEAAMARLEFPLEGRIGSPQAWPELLCKPSFVSLFGPVWDGGGDDADGVIRYEDWTAHELLST